MRKLMWAISIRTPRTSKLIKFKAHPKKAVEKAKEVKMKFRDNSEITVELISVTKAFAPPEDFKRKGNKWWCPYCRKIRVFKLDKVFDIKRCPVCGIGERDWYVRRYNNLWDSWKK